MSKTVLIDPRQAGISGDMLLGALVDLGASLERIQSLGQILAKAFPDCQSLEITATDVQKHGIRAKKVNVEIKQNYHHRSGAVLIKALENTLETVKASDKARRLARNSLQTICETEAMLHMSTPENIELHELGSVDTLVDIGGTALALEDLGLLDDATIYSLPVNVGGGKVKTSHGILSVPTLDVTEILRRERFPFEMGDAPHELSTPTGVGLLVNIAKPCPTGLQLRAGHVGYGAGTVELKAAPNILRVIVWEDVDGEFLTDEVKLIQTNLDDVSPEIIGHVVDLLFRKGARDVWTTPAFGKKNRPVVVLNALTDANLVEDMASTVIRETGTLGVRISSHGRLIMRREIIPVKLSFQGKTYTVRMKITKDKQGRVLSSKPEFDDARIIAEEQGLVLKKVLEMAEEKMKELLGEHAF